MNLSSGLPYTSEVYAVLMADYNEQWFLLILIAIVAGLCIIRLAKFGTSLSPLMLRCIGGVLAGGAACIGLLHQMHLMMSLNFMASFYAAGWGVFAAWIFIRWCVLLSTDSASDVPLLNVIGRGVMVFALFGYPVFQWVLDVPFASLDYVGTAPNSTILFIFGAILAFMGRQRPDLFVFPVIWSGIAGLHAYLLKMPVDFLVPALIIIATVAIFFTAERFSKKTESAP